VILGGESFGGEDDLMFGIDQCLGVVALDHAVGGGHFHGLVVNGIALDLFALAAGLGFLVFEELVQAFDLKLKPSFPFLLMFQFQLRLLIRLNMFCQHPLEFVLQLITLVFEFIESAAPLFGNIGGQFDAIQAEKGTAQQAEFIADEENVAENALDFVLHRRNKTGDGTVIGEVAGAKRHEGGIFAAGAFHLSGTDQASGIGKQNDLEQDLGVDGMGTGSIIFVSAIEQREIDMIFHQFVDGMFQ